MKRRDFIRYGMCGLAAVAVGSHVKIPPIFRTQAYAANLSFDVAISEAMVEMADKIPVYHWRFQFTNPPLPTTFPGPVIVANQGDTITINLTNTLDEAHAFAVIGANNALIVNSGSIAPGVGPVPVTFTAPAPGTYLYVDPLNAPVNRVLGLHGVLIVRPTAGNNPYGAAATANVAKLFNHLGTEAHFDGDPWTPFETVINSLTVPNRERLWLFSQVDAGFNAQVALPGAPALNAATFLANFIPDYYTINGISGAYASHPPHPDEADATMYRNRDVIIPAAFVGQPILIRILNAGVASHSAHIHGNHVYVTAINNVVQSNVILVDTFSITSPESNFQGSVPAPGSSQTAPILTGGSRVDWLLPTIRPPDVPGVVPGVLGSLLNDVSAEELALGPADGLITPASPFEFPMHCHTEMSQVMLGGNYPMGLVTHWEILGDRDADGNLHPFPGVLMPM